jgi:N6-adenosine-specific RNA methylase IME4|tara:strand:- start:558 stop:1088 length:531 start_codon:yes stop_codon:yes gene_type:complete
VNFPNKKYQIIYADPPWAYRDKAKAGKRGVGYKYDIMPIEDVKNLQVEKLSNDDCVLFMWITFPHLDECLSVVNSWGFKYKTVAFTWVKKYKNGDNFMGMGNWTRANAEICIIATKGKPKRIDAGVRQIVESIPERHSKKPDIVRDKIVKLLGDLPRIELFAREKVAGWDSWGNEI